MSTQASALGDLDWHVSRSCESGACVKVARQGKIVLIGNTNNPESAVSEFTTDEWRHFLIGVKMGDFDDIV
jgi:predicted secreted Zn-dependent protease